MITLLWAFTTLLILAGLMILLIHLGFRAPRLAETGTPADHDMEYLQLVIPTVADKSLFAWLLKAESDQCIIVLHGWGGNAELMLPAAEPFYRNGLNVLLFDARNHGSSDTHGFSSMPRFAEDLENAINWLQHHHPQRSRKIVLIGHSVGAAAVLLAASRRQDIDAVITVSAFAHPQWVMRRYMYWLPESMVNLVNRYVQRVIGHRFDDIAPLHTACRITCPILLVHGKDDTVVPLSDAHAIIKTCNSNNPNGKLTLLEIPDADHNPADQIEQHQHQLLNFLQDCGFKLRNPNADEI